MFFGFWHEALLVDECFIARVMPGLKLINSVAWDYFVMSCLRQMAELAAFQFGFCCSFTEFDGQPAVAGDQRRPNPLKTA
jgi:hypothetical protein